MRTHLFAYEIRQIRDSHETPSGADSNKGEHNNTNNNNIIIVLISHFGFVFRLKK